MHCARSNLTFLGGPRPNLRGLRVNPSLPPPHAVPNRPMLRYLRRNSLMPFVYYRIIFGIIVIALAVFFRFTAE